MKNFNDNFKEICSTAKLAGASIVVVKNGEVINYNGYGYASIDRNILANEHTIYRIASISKTIGAIGLMQLYEQNKIDLNEDISKYLGFKIKNPKYPNKKITLKMIMTQTSSITDGYDDENPDYDDIHLGYNGVNGTNLDVKLEDLLLEDGKYYTPLTFSNNEPGTNFIYSNFGCGLMACVIENVSGEHYDDYMRNHVFSPLNIDASFKAKNIISKDMIADLYYTNKSNSFDIARTKDEFINNGYIEFPIGNCFRGPAGGLFISMLDLSKLMMMFMNDGILDGIRILKKETVDLMYQQQWFGFGDFGGYRTKGLQMKVLHNYENKPLRGHTGGAYGVRSYLFYDRRNKTGACFITNGGYYQNLSSNLLDIFKYTLDNLFEYYWEEPRTTFAFSINANYALVNNRKIIFEAPLYIHNDIYMPVINFADGMNLIAFTDNDSITISKNGKIYEFVPIIENNIKYINVSKALEALNIDLSILNDEYKIEY